MKINRLGDSEQNLIIEALDKLEEVEYDRWANAAPGLEKGVIEYKLAHIQTTKALVQDSCLQELTEKVLSYVWNMYLEKGQVEEDMLTLMSEMGISRSEFESRFKAMGYEK